MPEIQLHEYSAKIKDMVRDGRHDEAIAHCKHVLGLYPKHVETYCLLGEACLEKGMYREAIEFFQRTLGADPENFIARVGLGIICDEQSALPEAIWHMERAFELAPGNPVVRKELQRLYAGRDGMEKKRLKLNRAALGRLYARNGLYERAIGEFRAVLRQDPDQPSIRVALLEALWHEGRRLEAVENCLDLLDDLPNCLKANLILGETWLRSGNEDAGEEKLAIARALDPENRVAQEMMGRESPLPAETVLVPELEVTRDILGLALAGQMVASTSPEWEEEDLAGALIPVEEPEWEGAETTDWLHEVGLIEAGEPALPEEGWAKEWGTSAEWALSETDIEPGLEPPPEEEIPAEKAPASEVPDWLQELVGEEPSEEDQAVDAELAWDEEAELATDVSPEEGIPTDEGVPEWLRSLATVTPEDSEALDQDAMWDEEIPLDQAELSGAEIPDWLQGLAPARAGIGAAGAGESVPAEDVSETELPDWLQSLRPAEAAAPPAKGTPPAEEFPLEEDEGGWLQDLGIPVAAAAAGAALAKALTGDEEEQEEEEDQAPIVEEAVYEGAALESEPAPDAALEGIEVMAAAGILEEVELGIASEEITPEEAGAELDEVVPDWMQDLLEVDVAPAAEAAPVVEAAPAVEAAPVVEETPAGEEPWADVAPAALPGEEALPEEDLFDAEAFFSQEFRAAEEIPEWLRDLAPAGDEFPLPEAAAILEGADAYPEEGEPSEADEAGWLEDLAAPATGLAAAAAAGIVAAKIPGEAEADEDEIPAVEEAAPDEIPESLRALVEAGILDEADLEAAMAEMSPEELEAQRAEAVPGWLQDLMDEEETVPAVAVSAEETEVFPEEDMPEWLRTLGLEEPAQVSSDEGFAEAEAEEIEEEMPAWLRTLDLEDAVELPPGEEIAEPEIEALEEEVSADQEVPAWLAALDLAEAVETQEVTEPAMEVEPEPEAQVTEAVRVLEEEVLPEIEPLPREEVTTWEEVPSLEGAPDWLKDLGMPAAATVTGAAIAHVLEDEAPVEEISPAEEAVPAADILSVPEEAMAGDEVPVFEEPTPPAKPVAGEVPESLRALVEAGILDEADLEAAMAEMSPEDLEMQRAEAVPDWLQDLMGEEEAVSTAAVPVKEAVPPVMEAPAVEGFAPPEAEAEVEEEYALPAAEVVIEEAAEETIVPEEEVILEEAISPVMEAPVVEEFAPPEAEAEVEEEYALPAAEVVIEEAAEETIVPEEEVILEEAISPLMEGPVVEEPAPPEVEAEVVEEYVPPVAEVTVEEAVVLEAEEEIIVETTPPAGPEIVEEATLPSHEDELLGLLKQAPRNHEARLELARWYREQGQYDAALNHYEKLITGRKYLPAVIGELASLTGEVIDRPRLYQLLGDAHMQNDQLDDALEMYRAARQALIQR